MRMMPSLGRTIQAASLAILTAAVSAAQIDPQLVGTWSTKSAKVLTGPGFYNPVADTFIEPKLTGISYSFTADGFYESAYYRAVPNPTTPACAEGLMQFQHGTVTMNSDLSLELEPFAVDGRQLQSNPCSDKKMGVYTRFNQSEKISKWAVYKDPYTHLQRLDLYRFDGSPMNPMFQAFNPPQMLPTSTMNPTAGIGAAVPTQTGSAAASKVKRWLGIENAQDTLLRNSQAQSAPLNQHAEHILKYIDRRPWWARLESKHVFWTALSMMLLGWGMRRMAKT